MKLMDVITLPIRSAEEIMAYLKAQKRKHPQVWITNGEDHIIA